MKSKTTKAIVNGVVLAAIAALGITVYQLGTSPIEEDPQQKEMVLEGLQEEKAQDAEGESMVDAGTSHVEASLDEETENLADIGELAETNGAEIENEELTETGSGAVTNEIAEDVDMIAENTVDIPDAALEAPELNFSEDTAMEWPVNGNILVDYSMDQTTYFPTLDQYKLSPAISVQAVEGAPVMAAANGSVYSITQDAQTGTTVTMELGNGYQAIYGQLQDLNVSEGDTIKKGTIIGYVSAPTKYYSTEGSNLYYAMKKDGQPIDPIMYLP